MFTACMAIAACEYLLSPIVSMILYPVALAQGSMLSGSPRGRAAFADQPRKTGAQTTLLTYDPPVQSEISSTAEGTRRHA